jgi:hypothetical protein
MNQDVTPKQALFLWRMVTGQTLDVREPMQSKAKPELNVKERQELLDKGYLSADGRGKGGGRPIHLVLTDRAWSWAGRTHDVELLQSNSPVGADVLQALLSRLLPFLQEHELPLASVLAGRKVEVVTHEAAGPDDELLVRVSNGAVSHGVSGAHGVASLSERVEAACLNLTCGQRKQRVRLSALRGNMTDVPREALDQALLDLQDAGRAVLYRDDNSAALTDADHAAALVVGEAPRHIIYLEA